jgi:hypothetical protein
MNDRELLEAAARAAGLLTKSDMDSVWLVEDDGTLVRRWRPLNDDGDEARLECDLAMDVCWYSFEVGVFSAKLAAYEKFSDHGGDKQKARRRAGVRAAAAMADLSAPGVSTAT